MPAQKITLSSGSGAPPDPTPAKTDAQRRRQRRYLLWLPILLVLAFIAFGYSAYFIPSSSMLPTLKPGDHVIILRSRMAYPFGGMPARGDIIVFRLAKNQEEGGGAGEGDMTVPAVENPKPGLAITRRADEDILIKRVIGLPGEKVEIRGNDIYINGKMLTETYAIVPDDLTVGARYNYAVDAPLTVPDDNLFVMGDNRSNSDDGRFWGTLKRRDVLGKFAFVLFHENQNGPNRANPKDRAENPTP